MRSKASIKSHPIHPILVAFPIAFYIGTWLFDGIGLLADNNDLMAPAYYLNIAAIVSAVLAAIPGIIDFSSVVPAKSSAKKRAAQHGLLNSTVLLLFGVAFYFRVSSDTHVNNDFVILAVESIAVILLLIAGWLGGTLVYRNQIGVDIRYANAGKWKEIYVEERNGVAQIKDVDQLQQDQMMLVHVSGKRIVVANTGSEICAFDDHCTHRGGSLAGGAMICGTVQCPWHGSQFDVKSGSCKAGPAKEPIATYNIVHDQGIWKLNIAPK